jgi:ATP-binding cassette subfamily F protein 3
VESPALEAAKAGNIKTATPPNRKLRRREKAEMRRHISATLKPIRDSLAELERRIDDLENKGRELEQTLADPDVFKDQKRSLPLLNEYGEVKNKLEELLLRWEYRQEELESARKELGLTESP